MPVMRFTRGPDPVSRPLPAVVRRWMTISLAALILLGIIVAIVRG